MENARSQEMQGTQEAPTAFWMAESEAVLLQMGPTLLTRPHPAQVTMRATLGGSPSQL